MTRIEQEKRVVKWMIEFYCKHHHNNPVCDECSELCEYATSRLSLCKFGENKTTCKNCPVHCYKPIMREKIRNVMRFSGPRMFFHHPIVALKHLFYNYTDTKKLKSQQET